MSSLLTRVLVGAAIAAGVVVPVAQQPAASAAVVSVRHATTPGSVAVIMVYRDPAEGQWRELTEFPPRSDVRAVAQTARALGAEVITGDFATKRGTAFFWSGLGSNGEVTAEHMATDRHGVTLGMIIDKRHIVMPAWDGTAKTELAWSAVSALYAREATGMVRVILGPHVRPNAIWYTEFDRLKANPRVTDVDAIESATGQETRLYTR